MGGSRVTRSLNWRRAFFFGVGLAGVGTFIVIRKKTVKAV